MGDYRDLIVIGLVFAGWLALNRWLLPRLGVPT